MWENKTYGRYYMKMGFRFRILIFLTLLLFVFPMAAGAALSPITASDGEANDAFGIASSIANINGAYYAVVGASGADGNSGAVYILKRGIDTWSQHKKLIADDNAAMEPDFFGKSVFLSGNWVIIGAPKDDDQGDDAGAAYIFNTSGWSQVTKFTVPKLYTSDRPSFGISVGIDDIYAVVGAYKESSNNDEAGAAYVYKYDGSSWSKIARLVADSGVIGSQYAYNHFGQAVAVSGDYIIIGVPNYDEGVSNGGAVYVFKRDGTNWVQDRILTASDRSSDAQFGISVSINKSSTDEYYAAIGASGDDGNKGAVYVFKLETGSWVQKQKLIEATPVAGNYFGACVSIFGPKLIIGAKGVDEGINTNVGAAYLFERNGETWSQTDSFTPQNGQAEDEFGTSVATSDEFFVIGAPGFNGGTNGENDSQGAAYVDVSGTVDNRSPAISDIPDTYRNDTNQFSLNFTVNDPDGTTLTLQSVTSDNQTVVPDGSIMVEDDGVAHSLPYTVNLVDHNKDLVLKITPAGYGRANITIIVQDAGGKTAQATFAVIVTHKPIINPISDQNMDEGSTATFAFQIVDEDRDTLTVSAESNNAALMPTSNITLNVQGNPGDKDNPYTLVLGTNQLADMDINFVPVDDDINSDIAGTAEITITVDDGSGPVTRTFTLTVNPVNDPPSISDISDLVLTEDVSDSVAFTVSDIDNNVADLVITAQSDKNIIAELNPGGTGSVRTLEIVPAPDANSGADLSDKATVTVTVSDGDKNSSTTFKVTITPVDDVPEIDPIDDLTTDEEVPVNVTFKVRHGDKEALKMTVTSGNTGLVPNENILINGVSSNPSQPYEPVLGDNKEAEILLNITPAKDQTGNATISVKVTDESNNEVTETFVLTVNPVNDAPVVTFAKTSDSINEDTTGYQVNFTVTDPDSDDPPGSLDVTAESNNIALVPNDIDHLSIGGTGENRWLIINPVANAYGEAKITVTAKDDEDATGQAVFTLTVISVNDLPTIEVTSADPVVTDEDTMTGEITFTISDADVEDELTVTVIPTNTDLVPNDNTHVMIAGGGNIYKTFLGGGSDTLYLKILPGENKWGATSITVKVSDGTGEANDIFQLQVNAVNDPPEISGLQDTYTDGKEDTTWGPVSFTVSDPENDTVTITAVSDNQALVPDANISIGGTSTAPTITVIPAANQSGTVKITVTANDGNGGVSTKDFTITFAEVNDAPTITPIGNQTMNEDDPILRLPFTIQDLDIEDLIVSVTVVDKDNANLFASLHFTSGDTGPPTQLVPVADQDATGSANLELAIKLAENQSGWAILKVEVKDGANETDTTQFSVIVDAVNDPPVISGNPPTDAKVATEYDFTPTASDPEDDPLTFEVSYVDNFTDRNPVAGPAWMVFDSVTGNLKGTPQNGDEGKIHYVILTVKDSLDNYAENPLEFTIEVTKDEIAPLINDGSGIPATEVDEAKEGDPPRIVSFTVKDGNGDPLTVTASVDPDDGKLVKPGGIKILTDSGAEITNPVDTEINVNLTLKLSIDLVPTANSFKNGTVNITVKVNDGASPEVSSTFQLTVKPVPTDPVVNYDPDPPAIKEPLNNKTFTTDEDTKIVIPIEVTDLDWGVLNLSAKSETGNVVPDANIDIGARGNSAGFGNSYTLGINSDNPVDLEIGLKPDTGKSGTEKITLTLTNGTRTNNFVFVVSVNPTNEPPEITANPTTWTMQEDSTGSFNVNISDRDDNDLKFTMTWDSSTPGFSIDGQHFQVNGSNYDPAGMTLTSSMYSSAVQVTITPPQFYNTESSGPLKLKIKVEETDADPPPNQSDEIVIDLVIENVNNLPEIDFVEPQTINEDDTIAAGTATPIAFTVDDADGDVLTLNVASDNLNLVDPTRIYLKIGADPGAEIRPLPTQIGPADYDKLALLIEPQPDANTQLHGIAKITITADDDPNTGGKTDSIFRLEVVAMPDAPRFDPDSGPQDMVMKEDETDLNKKQNNFGVGDADADTLTVKVESDNEDVVPNDKYNLTISGDPAKVGDTLNNTDGTDNWVEAQVKTEFGKYTPITLTITPLPDTYTTTPLEITVTLIDGDPATADTQMTFSVIVDPVNDPPVITGLYSPASMEFGVDEVFEFSVQDKDIIDLDDMQIFPSSTNTDLVGSDPAHLKVEETGRDPVTKTINYKLTVSTNADATVQDPYSVTNIGIRANDGSGGESTETFELRVFPKGVQKPEVRLSSGFGPDIDMDEDGTKTVDFEVIYQLDNPPVPVPTPPDGPADFEVRIESSDENIFAGASQHTAYYDSDATWKVHYYHLYLRPVANAFKTSPPTVITIRVNVKGYVASTEINVRVFDVNDPPVLIPGYNSTESTFANQPKEVTFEVSDVEDPANNLTVWAEFSQAGVVESHQINCIDGHCTMTLNPIAQTNVILSTDITLKVKDTSNNTSPPADYSVRDTTEDTFTFEVHPNNAPVVNFDLPRVEADRDTPAVFNTARVKDEDGGNIKVRLNAVENPGGIINSVLLMNGTEVVVSELNVTGTINLDPNVEVPLTLTVKPKAGVAGNAVITIRVEDASADVDTDSFEMVILTPGDFNNDGNVNMNDLIMVLRILANINVGAVNLDADVNGDGRVGPEDAIYILQYISLKR